MRSPEQRLLDIVEAISKINRFLPITSEELEENEERQVWFVYHLQIIGEATRLLPEPVRAQMPSIEWRQWVGLRHILVHEYFGVDLAAVYAAVTFEMDGLLDAVNRWLESEAVRDNLEGS